MKATSLIDIHRSLGAKMAPFAGWDMPIQYGGGPGAEVKSTRASVGLFDVSHMGEVRVTGVEAVDYLQYVASNDCAKLQPGYSQYSLLLNENGGVRDDIIVYRIDSNEFLVVVNAGCKDKDWEWLTQKARHYHVQITDESDDTALIAVQGPQALTLIERLSASGTVPPKRFAFKTDLISGISCVVSRTGYTGDDGVELFCGWNEAPALWTVLQGSGGEPCGLAARDVLRIEAAYPLYGHELKEDTSPMGSGLQWAVKMYKKDFIGRDAVVEKTQQPLREVLAGVRVAADAKGIPREGCDVYSDKVADPIGYVTSGTLSPTLGYGIAMARIGRGWADPGTSLQLDVRGRRIPIEVTKLPFYRNGV